MQTVKHRRRRQDYRQINFLSKHSDSSGQVRPDLWHKGIEHVKRMSIAAGMPIAGGVEGVLWSQVGPAPLRIDAEQIYQGAGPDSGEVTDIAIDPQGSTDQIIYIAANDGGIWKSTDAGATWTPKTDLMPSISMGAVALDPGNSSIVYAGTGNLFDGGSVFTKAVGVYKSIDGGDTWSIVGGTVLANKGVNRIVLPSPNVLLVGTVAGLFRSIDGGLNFGANAPLFNDGLPVLSGYVSDLNLDTASPSTTVYASISGQGIFPSTDGGVTFPSSANLFSNPGAPSGSYGFIAFTQSTQPDGQTMYASVQGTSSYQGLYKSTDGGASWTVMPDAANRAAENGGAQLGYDQTVGVDPQDANRVYIGFQELYVSTDGATTFGTPATSQNKIHWDHHALVFSPSSHWGSAPTQMYVGTDGGISTSTDGGSTWSNLNEGIATNLFLGIDIGRGSPANNSFTYGGAQDTGTSEHRASFSGTDWHLGVDGDGGPVAVDPSNPLRAYGSDDGGYMFTSDGGSTWNFPAGTGLPGRILRLAVDPNNSANVYATAGAQLFQSTDTGATFTSINTFPAAIASIATVSLDSNTLWVGLQDGTVQSTANALAGTGSTWTSFSTGAPTGLSAEGIAIDPFSAAHVVVAYAGFSGINPANRTQHVFQTTDNGATWNDISGTNGGDPTQNLPDLPLHFAVIDPGPAAGLHGITWSGSLFVTVGLNGTILTSPDGSTWTAQNSGTSQNLVDVIWSGSLFVIVGIPGTILTSPDGINWTTQSSGSTDALQGVAWSGSLFVVTDASTPTVLTSPDGVTWTANATGASNALLGVTWSGSLFVAVGYAGTILTSPDGVNWTAQTSGSSQNLVDAVWSGSLFVVVGDSGTILTSPDGVTWTPQTSSSSNELNSVVWSGSLFAAVENTGTIFTSPDGVTWTAQNTGSASRLIDITWSGSLFVTVGDFDTILTSPDGVTWTPQTPGKSPTAILVASDATVIRTIDSGASWQVLGVGLPTVDCKSLAFDWQATPSLLRVGTYGRSVFELTRPSGPRLAVYANLAFGSVTVGTSATPLPVQVFNVGSTNLTISSFAQTAGSTDFQISSGPSTPVVIPPGGQINYTFSFQPSSAGNLTATFQLNSDDPSQSTYQLPVSGTGS